MDYKIHKLTNWQWLDSAIAKMGVERFTELYDRICKRLDNLAPGEKYNIPNKLKEENIPLFIKIACSFILAHEAEGKEYTYNFSDDYTEIEKGTIR